MRTGDLESLTQLLGLSSVECPPPYRSLSIDYDKKRHAFEMTFIETRGPHDEAVTHISYESIAHFYQGSQPHEDEVTPHVASPFARDIVRVVQGTSRAQSPRRTVPQPQRNTRRSNRSWPSGSRSVLLPNLLGLWLEDMPHPYAKMLARDVQLRHAAGLPLKRLTLTKYRGFGKRFVADMKATGTRVVSRGEAVGSDEACGSDYDSGTWSDGSRDGDSDSD
ncbi:hypothetical protein BDV98DRAFT_391200 [Pterulicium gracile]|uniref:Uncharacterized protein n=1 Tax=Pterulicium gracile TaxID=1884261 RepID=A0A5C3QRZ0_9AGAR|nr:hypothetical protein BDV98DRAFT_391200 [Pterula gracilis]